MLFAFIKGFFTGASLIIAIGAQNAFVLRQGLRQQRHIAVAGACTVIDVLLIFVGVAGLGVLIKQHPSFLETARWGGAAFLTVYGVRSLWKARANSYDGYAESGDLSRMDVRNEHCLSGGARTPATLSLTKALLITVSLSLLNPHVYLDTVVLLGAIGGQLPGSGWLWFWLGASLASFCWFFSLSLAAKQLAPLFARPKAWRLLDAMVGLVMILIALQLVVIY